MRWLGAALLLAVKILLPTLPAHAQGSACDSISSQIDSSNQDLDQLKNQSQGWLSQVSQAGAIVPGDLAAATIDGAVPGLDPGTASTFGGLAATIGAEAGVWLDNNRDTPSGQYWQDMSNNLSRWEGLFAPMLPYQGFAGSLGLLSSALMELRMLAGKASADQALLDSLTTALDECQAGSGAGSSATPVPPTAENGGALCSVGGAEGHSNSECFRLELDAAFAEWTACTEAYFAAERAAFQSGGDLPVNTCDGPFKQKTEELQRQWGG